MNKESKPHILLIYSDQHRFDSMGCHGHSLVKTPNLDRLAAEGADFTNAYTPSPICVPARCSLLSGMFPVKHGVIHNFDGECFCPLDPEFPMHPRVVANAGYSTIHIGRWHVDPKRDGHAYGFDEFYQDWRYGKYRELKGYEAVPDLNDFWGANDNVTPKGESSLFWHARQVIARIERQLENSSDPFLIHWHMLEPHLPCRPSKPFSEMYDPADIEPWPGWQDDLLSKPWIPRHLRCFKISINAIVFTLFIQVILQSKQA